MPTNATPRNIGTTYELTTDDNGMTLFLGDASPSRTSVMTIQWVPTLPVVGDGFSLVARIYGNGGPTNSPDANATPFLPIPYRRINLAGVASDRAVVSATLPMEGFIIEVPANGQQLSIIPSITSGSGWLYHWSTMGSPT